MGNLSFVLDTLVLKIQEDINTSYSSNAFNTAFESYLFMLRPSLNRYRHHLSNKEVEIDKLKVRFKYETAFLHLLTGLVERLISNATQTEIVCWPVYQSDYPFSWYYLPRDLKDYIDQFDIGLLETGDKLENTLSPMISNILSHAGRRYVGEYYTPLPLAQHLVDLSGFHPKYLIEGSSMLDPACGGGVILMDVARRVVNYSVALGLNPRDTLNSLSHNISGFDIQPFAIVLTRTLLIYTCLPLITLDYTVAHEARFGKVKLFDPLPQLSRFESSHKKIDYIIANPPYLAIKKSLLDFAPNYADVLSGHPNLYQLFLWWAVRSASNKGVISFLTPQSILAGEYFRKLREQLDTETHIKSITRILDRKGVIGDADQQMMALCLLKKDPKININDKVVIRVTRNGNDVNTTKPYEVIPSQVVQRIGRTIIWVVSENALDYAIIERLGDSTYNLGEKRDLFVCGNGEFVWNEQKELLRTAAGNDIVPLISAASIEPYKFSFPYIGSHPSVSRQYSAVTDRVKKILHHVPLVLVQRTTPRKVGRRLAAAVLPSEFCKQHNAYFLENHVIYVKSTNENLLYGLMSWLNSDLVNFLFQMRNGTTHLSVSEMNILPLNIDLLYNISSLSEKMYASVPHELNKSVFRLNDFIFDWLRLESKHRERIREVLARTEKT